jgi:hypothetical protein
MRPRTAICSLILLTACNPAPQTIAVKDWPHDEQVEIAKERNTLSDGKFYCSDQYGKPISFPIALAVFDDWEKMRREIKGK